MIKDGGHAFPSPDLFNGCGQITQNGGTGMSLRNWFASNSGITLGDAKAYLDDIRPDTEHQYSTIFRTLCQMRLEYADAMIAEMDK